MLVNRERVSKRKTGLTLAQSQAKKAAKYGGRILLERDSQTVEEWGRKIASNVSGGNEEYEPVATKLAAKLRSMFKTEKKKEKACARAIGQL